MANLDYYRCPQCNAVCADGSDDDWQITCAKCHTSFSSVRQNPVSSEEVQSIISDESYKKTVFGAWEAYYRN